MRRVLRFTLYFVLAIIVFLLIALTIHAVQHANLVRYQEAQFTEVLKTPEKLDTYGWQTEKENGVDICGRPSHVTIVRKYNDLFYTSGIFELSVKRSQCNTRETWIVGTQSAFLQYAKKEQ